MRHLTLTLTALLAIALFFPLVQVKGAGRCSFERMDFNEMLLNTQQQSAGKGRTLLGSYSLKLFLSSRAASTVLTKPSYEAGSAYRSGQRRVHEPHDYSKRKVGNNVLKDTYFRRCPSARFEWKDEIPPVITTWLRDAVERFAHRQAEALAASRDDHNGFKYLIWRSPAQSGLGNRLIGLSSAYVMAMLTDRVLVIDAAKSFLDAHCDPVRSWNVQWMLPPKVRQVYQHSDQELFVRDGNYTIDTATLDYSHRTLKSGSRNSFCVKQFGERVDYRVKDSLACLDLNTGMDSVRVLQVISNEFFIPTFLENKHYRKRLYQLFPDLRILTTVSRYLFNPTSAIWDAVMESSKELRASNTSATIQARLFEGSTVEQHLNLAETFLNCLSSVHTRDSPIYVATMSPYIMEVLDANITNRVVSPVNIANVECLACGGSRLRSDLIEIHLLSMGRYVYVSPASTFGTFAAARAGSRPMLVQGDWDLFSGADGKYYQLVRKENHCTLMELSEVCFHNGSGSMDIVQDRNCRETLMGGEERRHILKSCRDWRQGLYALKVDVYFDE